ncbi:MAG: EamA family transporter RarD [Candidatus Nanopelagicales bacterium]
MGTTDAPPSQHRAGLLYGFAAYGIWGLFPLYFILLDTVSAFEIVANRVVWSLVLLLIVLGIRRQWQPLRSAMRSRRTVALLAAAAAMISLNWGVYAFAVTNDHVVEASLGYFFNPLVSVLLGVVLLRERLRKLQWSAVAIGAVAVIVLTASYGRPPWISLLLAFSFGVYGLVKKIARVGAVESLTIETMLLLPLAIAVMIGFARSGNSALAMGGTGIVALLVLLGPVTAVPLLAFGAAATRIPLSTIGLLQYLTPTIQFILGVWVFQSYIPPERWVGVGIVWAALAVFSWDALRHSRRVRDRTEKPSIIDELEVTVPD